MAGGRPNLILTDGFVSQDQPVQPQIPNPTFRRPKRPKPCNRRFQLTIRTVPREICQNFGFLKISAASLGPKTSKS